MEVGLTTGLGKAGYLKKRNGVFWSPRWFKVTEDCLLLYDTEAKAKLLKTMQLCDLSVRPSASKPCYFHLEYKAHDPMVLRATTKSEAKCWVLARSERRAWPKTWLDPLLPLELSEPDL